MIRLSIFLFALFSIFFSHAQTRTLYLGIGTGMTSSYTWDNGISKDPRYKDRYDIKFAPVSLNYGLDFEGYGFFINPGLVNIGQNFYVTNTVGGQQGTRKINLSYINLPAAFKLHIIDLSFFKLSLTAGGSFAFLMKGKETVSHEEAKLTFPTQVYPILPSDYTIVYDGVISPAVSKYTIADKKDFKSYQVFALLGFRSDWEVSDDWMMSLDFRMNYGIFDPRTDEYMQRVNAYQTLYDISGKRRDMFALINVSVSRYIELKKEKHSPKKRSSYPSHKSRSRPRG
ncbi:outer membrane beta-barrel protein [Ohtaekwangia kribbensis]|jgi:hypothetical protein|uniref:Outer membrane beta-barrel protein n=1 Tax=Ohtaekwangia kribbensis TaxID=688913 RepID=A0ABW3KBZ2_9BACT